jgi:hypothetical protein
MIGIKFNVVLLQERQELFFVIMLAVMFGLLLDVGDGVSFLRDSEVNAPYPYPERGLSFAPQARRTTAVEGSLQPRDSRDEGILTS